MWAQRVADEELAVVHKRQPVALATPAVRIRELDLPIRLLKPGEPHIFEPGLAVPNEDGVSRAVEHERTGILRVRNLKLDLCAATDALRHPPPLPDQIIDSGSSLASVRRIKF